MHSGFEQFHAFAQDAIANRAMLAAMGKLKMPVFALGGEKRFGVHMAEVMRGSADDVNLGIFPGSGDWILEENPAATVKLVREFLDAR